MLVWEKVGVRMSGLWMQASDGVGKAEVMQRNRPTVGKTSSFSLCFSFFFFHRGHSHEQSHAYSVWTWLLFALYWTGSLFQLSVELCFTFHLLFTHFSSCCLLSMSRGPVSHYPSMITPKQQWELLQLWMTDSQQSHWCLTITTTQCWNVTKYIYSNMAHN